MRRDARATRHEPRATTMDPVRIAHFSDIHVGAPPFGFRVRDRFNKRAIGWMNVRYGRGKFFRQGPDVLRALGRELARERFDHVVFSGDATMMGFDGEYEEAVQLLGLDRGEVPSGIAVPGNHDIYLPVVARGRRFEHYFASWQKGERIDGETYPFAQRVGGLWLIGVNASRPTRWPWDASGRVGRAQRERLRRLLGRLGPGPRVLVVHYPPCMANGRSEPILRRLRDRKQMTALAGEEGVSAWLCGHRHLGYLVGPGGGLPFPVLCAGSATQMNRWAYNDYTFRAGSLTVRRRVFSPETGGYVDGDTVEVLLR